jgi:hypothetical protein
MKIKQILKNKWGWWTAGILYLGYVFYDSYLRMTLGNACNLGTVCNNDFITSFTNSVTRTFIGTPGGMDTGFGAWPMITLIPFGFILGLILQKIIKGKIQ